MKTTHQALGATLVAAAVLFAWRSLGVQTTDGRTALEPAAEIAEPRDGGSSYVPSLRQVVGSDVLHETPSASEVAVAVPHAAAPRVEESGRAVFGWVLDPAGRGLPGARVTPWRHAGASRVLDKRRSRWTDETGRFEVLADATGHAELVVEHEDYLLWDGVLDEVRPANIQVRAACRLLGRVLSARGLPALGSTIEYDTQDLRPARRLVSVDEEGRFVIDGLRPGTLAATIRGPHGSLGPLEWNVGEATDELVVRLPEVDVLRVRVLDAQGAALEGARVSLIPQGQTTASESKTSDGEGNAVFAVAPGTAVRFSASHPHGLFDDSPLSTARNNLTMRSRPCGTLLFRHDSAVAIALTLTHGSGPSRSELTCRVPAGRELRLTSLEVGAWTATSGCLAPAEVLRFEVREGQEARAQLATLPTSSITGVLPPQLSYLCQAEVRRHPSGRVVESMQLHAGSRFSSLGLEPGLYSIQLLAEGGGAWEDPRVLQLDAGQELIWEPSPSAASVQLQVRNKAGQPITSASAKFKSPTRSTPTQAQSGPELISRPRAPGIAAGADGSGAIRLELWQPEHQIAVVQAPGYHPAEVEIGAGTRTVHVLLDARP